MTNSPKDLDQANVEADARRMMEDTLDRLSNDIDPLDLGMVLETIADMVGGSMTSVLDSPLGIELMRCSQSNPERADAAIRESIRIHDAINNSL